MPLMPLIVVLSLLPVLAHNKPFLHRWSASALLLVGALLLSGCASPSFSVDGQNFQSPRSASRAIASQIAEKLSTSTLPLALGTQTPLLIGPSITSASGEITRSGRELQTFLLLDLKSLIPEYPIERLGGDSPVATSNVLSGTVRYESRNQKNPEENWFIIILNLHDKEGEMIGEARFRINARQFDPTPSRFFENSPIFLSGNKSANQTQKSSGATSKNLEIAARADRAIVAYEASQFANAQKSFQEIADIDKENLLALTGIYQTALAMGKREEAQQALDNLIDAGLRVGHLNFKFLFRVRSAEFRDDFDIAKEYHHWIERIGARLSKTTACLNIFGHSSKTGTVEYNAALSTRRAERVAQILLQQYPTIAKRIKVQGMGFTQNIVGSGTDDAADAIDRRVEFHITPC